MNEYELDQRCFVNLLEAIAPLNFSVFRFGYFHEYFFKSAPHTSQIRDRYSQLLIPIQ
ncbi:MULTISPECIES: hypothetical protein [unclassified Anabaena]|uniref:hypothetical protein n=1 Tax=unclassified Anabaena TaxID=2619674 RepID=UPI000B05955C|nr:MULTISPECIES: hypothetical protein [unclassified Anabaena]